MIQMELFEQPKVVVSSEPSVETIRARCNAVLNRLREADRMPLTPRELAFWKVVMPQTTNWLPPEERKAVCEEFTSQVLRLEALDQNSADGE
jgi:hypothetical protein